MQTSRRQLITGAAALGAAGLGLAGPARAEAYGQSISNEPLSNLDGLMGDDGEGYCLTAMDLEMGAAKVDVVWTRTGAPNGVAAFSVAAAETAGVIDDALSESYRLRSLCSQGGGKVMMLFEFGGQPAPEKWYLRQTAAEYQQTVTSASRAGLEPVYVSVDNQDGAPRFTTLLRRSKTQWEARHHVKRSELTDLALAMKAKGLRVARSVPYLLGGELRFCNLYRPAGTLIWESWMIDETEFEARHGRYQAKGCNLLQAIRFVDGGRASWSAVWQQPIASDPDLFWGS